MVSHLDTNCESWMLRNVGGVFEQENLQRTKTQKERVDETRMHNATRGVEPVPASQPFSPLRLLFWASLFVGVHSQLTDPFPRSMELSGLDGKNGFTIKRVATSDSSAFSVSTAGDFNGDGFDDIIIGAPGTDLSGIQDAGRSYVVYGGKTPFRNGVFDLLTLNGTNGFIFNGVSSENACGFSVSFAGDVNGDGLSDLIIGARWANPPGKTKAGQSYVIFGSRFPINGGVFDLSKLDGGTHGFIINGEFGHDESGRSVSNAGDVNGDGLSDILIGAYSASPNGRTQAGKSYVVFGSQKNISGGVLELSSLNGLNGFSLNGVKGFDYFSRVGSAAGDVNGDGFADLLIGAPRVDIDGMKNVGRCYLIYGKSQFSDERNLDQLNFNRSNGFIINGEAEGDESGSSVASIGDVNGDGLSDFIIGAPYASPPGRIQAGKSYVVYGSRNPITGGVLELSGLDGSNGFVIHGETTGDKSGISVSSAGDVNGDGLSDIVVGAYHASLLGRTQAGKSYIIFGRRTPIFGGVLELSELNGNNGFILNGIAAGDKSGASVSSAGDVNGDGISDIVIGDQGPEPLQIVYSEKCFVIYGRRLIQKPQTLPSTAVLNPSQNRVTSPAVSIPNVQRTSSPIVLSPFLASTSNSLNLLITDESKGLTFPNESPSTKTKLLVAGIASAVTALAISLFGGMLYYFNIRSKTSTSVNRTPLEQHQPDPSINDYDKLPPPAQIYDPVVIGRNENENNNYDIVDVNKNNPDHKYDSPQSPL